jgi:hypothetical protein
VEEYPVALMCPHVYAYPRKTTTTFSKKSSQIKKESGLFCRPNLRSRAYSFQIPHKMNCVIFKSP